MSVYTIEINDEAVREQMQRVLSTILNDELGRRYTGVGDTMQAAVKELIYSRKDEIIDKVIDKATTEIVKKGLPRLLERMSEK